MRKKIRPMLPYAAILIANMYIVFFLIDRVNTAMNFIDNGLTKGLLLAMCLLVLGDALVPSKRPRRASGGAKKSAEAKPGAADAPRPRHAARS